MNFSAIFPMYLGTTKATSKKNQVQRCFRFPGILLSQDTYNDTHYEIIGVDCCTVCCVYCFIDCCTESTDCYVVFIAVMLIAIVFIVVLLH